MACSRSSTHARAASSPACADIATSSSRRRSARTEHLREHRARTGRCGCGTRAPRARSDRRSASDGGRPATRASAPTETGSPSRLRRHGRRLRRPLAPATRTPAHRREASPLRRLLRDGRCLLAGQPGRPRTPLHGARPAAARPGLSRARGLRLQRRRQPGRPHARHAGTDGQVRLWDVASRQPIGTPLPGPENINAVAYFAPDGDHVFAVFATAAATAGTSAPRRGNARRAWSPAVG